MKLKALTLTLIASVSCTTMMTTHPIENAAVLHAADLLKVLFEAQLGDHIFQEIINNLGEAINGTFSVRDVIMACIKLDANKAIKSGCPCCALYTPLMEHAQKNKKKQRMTILYTIAGTAAVLGLVIAAHQLIK